MGFSEVSFAFVFMPLSLLACIGSFRLNYLRAKDVVLVIVSLIFYMMSGAGTLGIFVMLVLFAYAGGRLIEKSGMREKKTIMILLTAAAVIILAFYKYSPDIITCLIEKKSGDEAAGGVVINAVADLSVPIGISFITFEIISYFSDIYNKKAGAGSLLDTFLFLSLYPKLISGPIVQWKDFQPQIKVRNIDTLSISKGIDRIIIGLAKKVIIADSLAGQLSRINIEIGTSGVDTPTLWLSTILFFFEIYYDFAGYSDVAIGLCRILGFSIEENFDFPYLSKSVSEFWRRWHISLGAWFREYVYIPMGGSRSGNVYLNLMAVFLITGIWHGNGLQYLLWGAANGLAVVIERIIKEKTWYRKIPPIIKWSVTTVFIFFAWTLFSSADISAFSDTLAGLFHRLPSEHLTFTWEFFYTRKTIMIIVIAAAGAFGILDKAVKEINRRLPKMHAVTVKNTALILLLMTDALFIVKSSYTPFLYFQF